jgi:hypothetical protein
MRQIRIFSRSFDDFDNLEADVNAFCREHQVRSIHTSMCQIRAQDELLAVVVEYEIAPPPSPVPAEAPELAVPEASSQRKGRLFTLETDWLMNLTPYQQNLMKVLQSGEALDWDMRASYNGKTIMESALRKLAQTRRLALLLLPGLTEGGHIVLDHYLPKYVQAGEYAGVLFPYDGSSFGMCTRLLAFIHC